MAALLVEKNGFALGLDIRKDIVELSEKNINKWKEKNPDEQVNVKFELRNCFLVDPEGKFTKCY